MKRYVTKRILQTIPLILLISFIVFSMIYIAPFDAIDAIRTPNMSIETVEFLKEKHGLDQPFLVQYLRWLKNVLMGDFRNSIITQASISEELPGRIINTISLIVPAYTISFLLAISLGIVAGSTKNSALDKIIDTTCSIGIATPTFWFAMLVIYLFGYRLNAFPIIGMHTIGKEGDFIDFLQHLFMPCLVLTIAVFPSITRYVRSSTISQMEEGYIIVQKSLGATKFEILKNHVLKGVMLPVTTILGQSLPMLVTGATVTESIFQWPGVGNYFLKATKQMDYPVIMAVLLISSTLTILGNLIADILYAFVDPRIREGSNYE